jgi:hypothetical protein
MDVGRSATVARWLDDWVHGDAAARPPAAWGRPGLALAFNLECAGCVGRGARGSSAGAAGDAPSCFAVHTAYGHRPCRATTSCRSSSLRHRTSRRCPSRWRSTSTAAGPEDEAMGAAGHAALVGVGRALGRARSSGASTAPRPERAHAPRRTCVEGWGSSCRSDLPRPWRREPARPRPVKPRAARRFEPVHPRRAGGAASRGRRDPQDLFARRGRRRRRTGQVEGLAERRRTPVRRAAPPGSSPRRRRGAAA